MKPKISKMEIFKELKIHLKLIGIFRVDSSEKEKKLAIFKNCVIIGTLGSGVVSIAWFRLFDARSTREITESSIFALGTLLPLAWYSVLMWQQEKYVVTIDELDTIIEQRTKDPSVKSIYEKTNRRIEIATKHLYLLIKLVVALYSLFPIVTSIFNYVTSGFSNEFLEPIYPATYPFDRTTLLGYFVCIVIQINTTIIGIECYTPPLILTVGFCMFIADFASDLREKLRQFNEEVMESKGKTLTPRQSIRLKKKLCEFIQFHSDAREFAIRFSDVNQFIVTACPMFTVAVFGVLVLQSKTIIESGDIIGMLQTAIMIFCAMFPFALFCHFGGTITHEFENIGADLWQLDWDEYPMEVRRRLPIIIAFAQKRIYMRGYGDTRTTYSVLKKILKNKFYYYMLVRKF